MIGESCSIFPAIDDLCICIDSMFLVKLNKLMNKRMNFAQLTIFHTEIEKPKHNIMSTASHHHFNFITTNFLINEKEENVFLTLALSKQLTQK